MKDLLILILIAFRIVKSDGNYESFTCPVRDPIGVSTIDAKSIGIPFIDGVKKFMGGSVIDYTGASDDVFSPITDISSQSKFKIGKISSMTAADAEEAVEAAKKAWNYGQGQWPRMSVGERIDAILKVVDSLKEKRTDIVNALKWEICKNDADAASEFDRTVKFIESTIESLQNLENASKSWKTISGIIARVKRAAIGIMLCLGPFNYPFNETYATLIPALLMGNVVIMKIPNIGGLAHMLTIEAYARHLPPGKYFITPILSESSI
jgi:glyceraldehyde-3-phosphate dehydrogenase (NADP+)